MDVHWIIMVGLAFFVGAALCVFAVLATKNLKRRLANKRMDEYIDDSDEAMYSTLRWIGLIAIGISLLSVANHLIMFYSGRYLF